ncbi:MAG TPA: DMT family transporter [Kofleriaceae bacterium]|nr:DMT family transporter [Kofleriaceae bacterium]
MRASVDAGGSVKAVVYTVAAAFFAAVFLLAFRAARDAPRASFVALVIGFAALTNLAWVGRHRRVTAIVALTRRELWVALAIAVFTIAGNLSVAWSITSLGSGQAATIAQTEIFFVAITAWIGLGERPSGWLVLGVLLAAAGILLTRLPAGTGSFALAGVLWGLAAALAFAMILVVARGSARHIDVERVNSVRLVIAAPLILLTPGAAAGLADLSLQMWLLAAVAAVAGPVTSRLFQLYAVKSLAAATVKLGMLTCAVFAYVLDAALFGRIPTATEMIAAILILCGTGVPAAARRWRAR